MYDYFCFVFCFKISICETNLSVQWLWHSFSDDLSPLLLRMVSLETPLFIYHVPMVTLLGNTPFYPHTVRTMEGRELQTATPRPTGSLGTRTSDSHVALAPIVNQSAKHPSALASTAR